jgi:hypothetical protein
MIKDLFHAAYPLHDHTDGLDGKLGQLLLRDGKAAVSIWQLRNFLAMYEPSLMVSTRATTPFRPSCPLAFRHMVCCTCLVPLTVVWPCRLGLVPSSRAGQPR